MRCNKRHSFFPSSKRGYGREHSKKGTNLLRLWGNRKSTPKGIRTMLIPNQKLGPIARTESTGHSGHKGKTHRK